MVHFRPLWGHDMAAIPKNRFNNLFYQTFWLLFKISLLNSKLRQLQINFLVKMRLKLQTKHTFVDFLKRFCSENQFQKKYVGH